jgi:hypothetical protein
MSRASWIMLYLPQPFIQLRPEIAYCLLQRMSNTFTTEQKQSQQMRSQPTNSPGPKYSARDLPEPPILHFERLLGKQAVRRLLSKNTESGIYIQPKLAVSSRADPSEQEADQVAERVVRTPDQQLVSGYEPKPIKPAQVHGAGLIAAPSIVHQALSGAGQFLDQATRSFMEPRFGADFSQIRVHTGKAEDAALRVLNAQAFTVGRELVFAARHYSPQTDSGRQLLAHELAHTLQQQHHFRLQRGGEGDEVRPDAQAIYNEFSGDNTALGEELYRLTAESLSNIPIVFDVMELVSYLSSDNVAYAFLHPLSDDQLKQIAADEAGRELLVYFKGQMGGPLPETDEIERIDQVLAAPPVIETKPAAPGPDLEAVRKVVAESTADQKIDPPDWKKLSTLDPFILESSLEELGMLESDAETITSIATQQEALFVSMRDTYVASLDPASKQIQNEPLIACIDLALKDLVLTLDEARGIRRVNIIRDIDPEAILAGFGLDPRSQATLSLVIQGSFLFPENGSLLPIQLEKGAEGNLNPKADLSIGIMQELFQKNNWLNNDKNLAYDVLKLEPDNTLRVALLQAAGLEEASAQLLVDKYFGTLSKHILENKLLQLSFMQSNGLWSLTEISQFNISLPYLSSNLAAPAIVEEYLVLDYVGQKTVSAYRFPSNYVGDALVLLARLDKHPLEIVIPATLAKEKDKMVNELEFTLPLVPAGHSMLIKKIEFDPLPDPSDPNTAAIANENEMKITVFNGRIGKIQEFIHEIGHLVAINSPDVFFSKWPAAMEQDRYGISIYGFYSLHEDFAETYEYYRSGGKENSDSRRRYANRFAILDSLEGG